MLMLPKGAFLTNTERGSKIVFWVLAGAILTAGIIYGVKRECRIWQSVPCHCGGK
jgi:hypothetical protein